MEKINKVTLSIVNTTYICESDNFEFIVKRDKYSDMDMGVWDMDIIQTGKITKHEAGFSHIEDGVQLLQDKWYKQLEVIKQIIRRKYD